MADIVVAAKSRTETGKNVNRRLRVEGLIPGVLYGGKKKAPQPVAVSPKDITAVLRSKSGLNTLFDLEIGGSKLKVILKEFQIEPVKSRLLHADFYEVALDKKLELKVHVEVHGVPVGVKTQGGILDFVTRELDIQCLPADIPDKIDIDVSDLEMGKHLRVADLKLSDKLTILTDPDVVIVHVVAARAEEVAPVAEEVAAVAVGTEPEVIKKGKTEAAAGEDAKAADKKPEKKEKKEKK